MFFDKLESIMNKYKYTIAAIGILILILNYFNISATKFYNQLGISNQIIFIGFLNFSIIIVVAIIILNRIDNQPLYRFTRLDEPGKRLILDAKNRKPIDLHTFSKDKFKLDELIKQTRTLENYGWITVDENIVQITKRGIDEVSTFEELCSGRYRGLS